MDVYARSAEAGRAVNGMPDKEKIIKDWESILSRDPLDVPWDLIDETLALLKEQEKRIEDLQDIIAILEGR